MQCRLCQMQAVHDTPMCDPDTQLALAWVFSTDSLTLV